VSNTGGNLLASDNAEVWPRVLVVDDIEDNRAILQRRLMVAHFEVDEADSGERCLALLETTKYAAILLDYQMPGMDGLETLRHIRARWSKLELPVIIVTARDDDPLIIQCLDQGANDHVAKPFSFPVLVARVRALLKLSADAAAAA
jgi:DNA-binding response OmpR family regulator